MSADELDDVEPTVEEQGEIVEFLNVDECLEDVVGSHGLWQWLIALYLMISTPSPTTLPVYANNHSPFRCRMEEPVEDYITRKQLTFTEVAKRIGPWSNSNNSQVQSTSNGCTRYSLDWLTANLDQIFQTTSPTNLPSTETEKCPLGYIFSQNNNNYPGNVVKEFDLVCDKAFLQSLGTSVYMFGMLIGFLIGGWCGDRFGRRLTLTVASAVEIFGTIIVCVAPNFAVYVLFRAVVAVGNTVKVSVGNVLVYEITVARYRSMFGAILALGLDFVFRAYMALCAYLIPDWRALNGALMCTGALGFLYPLILPESPRWLISQKRLRKAIDEMHRGCQINERHSVVKQEDYFDQLRDRVEQIEERIKPMRPRCRCHCKGWRNAIWMKLFKTAKLIRLTALSSFVVFGITMCFFGLLLYAEVLSGSIYLNGFLSSLTAIPANVGAGLIYRFIRSRKKPLVAILSLAAIALVFSLFNSFVKTKNVDLVLTICSNIGLILINASVCMIYVYVAEFFPSEIRSYGFGFVFALSRVGAMICPFVNDLDASLSHGSPMVIYAALLIAVVWTLNLLPETHGENICDFVEQKQTECEDDDDEEEVADGIAMGNERTWNGRTESRRELYLT
ncbi:Solute carrier family 22 member 5 [Fasciolopsis buskii]|uniref:Solute carrier family 22 member 5 n=1 Tax=Fasciolopsis buskii TaxID=27845 RepID=A0A8E0RQ46_9TREM|nr:Solute carrier family 22 member 5 [Fasciolopsis buski]